MERPRRGRFLDVCSRSQHARGVSVESWNCRNRELRAPNQLLKRGVVNWPDIAVPCSLLLTFLRADDVRAQRAADGGAVLRSKFFRPQSDLPRRAGISRRALKKLRYIGVRSCASKCRSRPTERWKSTKLLGGSPILGQSTMKAVKQWKYAPAATEEILTVKLEFDPHR